MDAEISFPDNWSPPPELARALPREVRMSGYGRFLSLFFTLLIASSVAMCFFMRRQIAAQSVGAEALRTQGVDANGEVGRLWREGRSNTPMVGYMFTAGTMRVRGESSVPEKLWPHVQKAGMIPIRYLPSDPLVNHPAEWEESAGPLWIPFLFPAMVLVSAAFLFANLRRQANLLAEGVPAQGVVTGCHHIKGGWSARYRFRTREGAIAGGRCKVRHKLATGASVCVLHDPQDLGRNRIYPMDAYRLA